MNFDSKLAVQCNNMITAMAVLARVVKDSGGSSILFMRMIMEMTETALLAVDTSSGRSPEEMRQHLESIGTKVEAAYVAKEKQENLNEN